MKKEEFKPVIDWHESLLENKGERARLRRCKSLENIFLQPAYVDLCQKLSKNGDKIALIAGVFSHIKEGANKSNISLAKQMSANKKGNDTPIISRARFQRLLAMKERDSLYRLMIRTINQVDGFDFLELAKDLFYWNDTIKKNWAYKYYSTQGEKK